jgi:cyclopropane-fatty-acyl-phospholipid synthase
LSVRVHETDQDSGRHGSLVRRLLEAAGNPRLRIRLWTGEEFDSGSGPPAGCVEFHSRRALFDVLRSPSIGFGEGYSQGRIDVHGNFAACIEEISRAIVSAAPYHYGRSRLASRLHSLRSNSLTRSRDNVHHHYDLGNGFYAKWLDERMVYTCAYYPTPDASLAEAQLAKLEHVCRKLRLKPGQTVVEAGCGWGALSLHMARHYGVRVHAWNNSREQIRWAREKARAEGLEDRVTFHEDDYRAIDVHCDAFVSVGMLEHVGLANYRQLGELISGVLRPDGIGLIHSIGRSHPKTMDAWILKRIFPGGHAPSLGEMMPIFEPGRLAILDIENLRPHYARTCADWLQNFEAVADEVEEEYGTAFVRAWRLYLAGSSAGFRVGSLQLYQVLFAPSGSLDHPWTRHYLYPASPAGRG